MCISDILSEKLVFADIEADTKRQLLENLATVVAEAEDLDKNTVFEAIWERENLGSTGYGNGIAFPHARIPGLQKVIAVVARLSAAIDYDAIDAKPVDIVAFLISPENSGEDHLQGLAALSRVLKNEDVCREIRMAKGTHEIYLALNK